MISISENRRVRHDFNIIKSYEAGVSLKGSEVKSIRARRSSIKDAYCYESNNEIYIKNYHIALYPNAFPHDVLRIKKLLLHKHEIRNIKHLLSKHKYTIVPTSVYIKNIYIKIEIAVVENKTQRDKRITIRERDYKRSIRMEI